MFGGHHFFGWERRSRLFERGDLKYVILDLLKDKPSHGYEIIRALEERSHGFYSPSAGSVYPTLQLLEDMGCVSSAEQDGKKTYAITEQGKGFLTERKENIDKIKEHMNEFWTPGTRGEVGEIIDELRGLGRSLHGRIHRLDRQKLVGIKEVVAKARHDIEAILGS
jgi:DNA-binding PadR family transcriptional regulator